MAEINYEQLSAILGVPITPENLYGSIGSKAPVWRDLSSEGFGKSGYFSQNQNPLELSGMNASGPMDMSSSPYSKYFGLGGMMIDPATNQPIMRMYDTSGGNYLGQSDLIDPKSVKYDPNIGVYTSYENITPVDDQSFLNKLGEGLTLATIGAIAGGAAGLYGAAGGGTTQQAMLASQYESMGYSAQEAAQMAAADMAASSGGAVTTPLTSTSLVPGAQAPAGVPLSPEATVASGGGGAPLAGGGGTSAANMTAAQELAASGMTPAQIEAALTGTSATGGPLSALTNVLGPGGTKALSTLAASALTTGGGGGGGGGDVYTPGGVSAADKSWQANMQAAQGLTDKTVATTQPLYDKTLAAQNAINYDPYLQASNQAGQDYAQLANQARMMGGSLLNQSLLPQQQQRALYDASNQVYQTALDPRQALYNRTQQQLQDQVRQGQAARGLGASAVGGSEENQAMSNFNIDWQNQQLARQAQGLQAMAQGSNAGGQQGQLYNADLAGAMSMYGQVPDYTQQSGQVPLKAQQYVAGQPAANANQYQQGMSGLTSMYQQQQNQALPYMFPSINAQQTNLNAQNAQNAATAQNLGGLFQSLLNSGGGNQWGGGNQGSGGGNRGTGGGGSWLTNLFGGGSNTAQQNTYDPWQIDLLGG